MENHHFLMGKSTINGKIKPIYDSDNARTLGLMNQGFSATSQLDGSRPCNIWVPWFGQLFLRTCLVPSFLLGFKSRYLIYIYICFIYLFLYYICIYLYYIMLYYSYSYKYSYNYIILYFNILYYIILYTILYTIL